MTKYGLNELLNQSINEEINKEINKEITNFALAGTCYQSPIRDYATYSAFEATAKAKETKSEKEEKHNMGLDNLLVHKYLRLEEFIKVFSLKSAYVKQLTTPISKAPLLIHLTFLPNDRDNFFLGMDTSNDSYIWVVKRLGVDTTYDEVILYVDMIDEKTYEDIKPHKPYDPIALLKPLLPPGKLMQFNIYARTEGGIENHDSDIRHYEEECLEVYTNPTYFNKYVDKSILDKLAFEPRLSVGTHTEGTIFSPSKIKKECILSVNFTVIKEEEKEEDEKK